MSVHQTRSNNGNWKGGRTKTAHGYYLVRAPWHPACDVRGYVYEHRLVAEWTIGRQLKPGEVVHHINGRRGDNRPENLQVMPSAWHHRAEHRKRSDLRSPGEPNPEVACACGCGAHLRRYDAAGRPRRFLPGHNGRKTA